MSSPGPRKGSSSHHGHTSDRLYEEYENERRLKKRRLRLLAATEDAFVHLRKITEEKLSSKGKTTQEVVKIVRLNLKFKSDDACVETVKLWILYTFAE